MKQALILVDYQNEWQDGSSENYLGDLSGIIDKTNKVIDFCRQDNTKIVFTQHIEKEEGNGFVQGAEGTELISTLHRQDSDAVVVKHKISPFYQTALDEVLEGVDKIIVCGILTNMCVRSLVQDAYDRGFEIVVIKDCCRTYSEKTNIFTFEDLKETRPEIQFVNLEEFIK
ncbi:MAG: isochorismatase family cysteine hydrolase [Patescibacteria group bacterium]